MRIKWRVILKLATNNTALEITVKVSKFKIIFQINHNVPVKYSGGVI